MKLNSKNIDCFFFSGTGNTEFVLDAMISEFKSNDFNVNRYEINQFTKYTFDLSHVILLAIPVAFTGTYPFIWDFINNMPKTKDTQVILITTYSNNAYGLSNPVKRKLKKKGYKPFALKKYKMPDYYLRTEQLTAKELKCIEDIEMNVKNYTLELIYKDVTWDGTFFSKIFNRKENKRKMWDKLRKQYTLVAVDGFCKKCQTCITVCPVNNIRLIDNKIMFGNKCEFCQKCISSCKNGGIIVFDKGESRDYITSDFYTK